MDRPLSTTDTKDSQTTARVSCCDSWKHCLSQYWDLVSSYLKTAMIPLLWCRYPCFFFLFCNVPALYSKFSAGAVCTVHVWFHGVWNCIELLDSLKCFFVAVKQIVTEFYYFKDSETQHYHNIYITTVSRRYADMSEWLTVVRVWFCLFLPCFIEHPVYLWLISLCLRAVWRGEAGFQLQPHCSHLFLSPCNQPGY